MDRFNDDFLMPAAIRADGTVEFPPEWTKEQREAYLDRIRKAAEWRRAQEDADPGFEDSAVIVSDKV